MPEQTVDFMEMWIEKGKYVTMNAINAKYDLYMFEITCLEEAEEFYHDLEILYNLGKVAEDDMKVCLLIMDHWNQQPKRKQA